MGVRRRLPEVSRAAFDYAHRKLPGPDLRAALADCATVETDEFERRIGELISELATTHSVPKRGTRRLSAPLPLTVRQALRRPSDPHGRTPRNNSFSSSRKSSRFSFRPGFRVPPRRQAAGLDSWTLTELRGWARLRSLARRGRRATEILPGRAQVHHRPRDPRPDQGQHRDSSQQVFSLNSVAGILPLRSVYLESDPPCLEAPFVYGYDLAGLIFEWKWRYDSAKPEAALKLIRRLAAIVAEAHAKGIVHRDLKPSQRAPSPDRRREVHASG